MEWEDVKELHYITPIENLPSILEKGILSHKLAGEVPHLSVALEDDPGAAKEQDHSPWKAASRLR